MMKMIAHKLEQIEKIWPFVAPVFSVPRTREAYDRLVSLLDDVAKRVGEDEDHPLALLMDTLGTLVEVYETENFPDPEVSPVETSRFLMEEHELGRDDLPELGESAAEILEGRRSLDVHQAYALGRRFNVPGSIFLD